MKKPKTRRLVKSIKHINKQARNLRRGVVRRSNIVRHKEQERPRSSTEQIQEHRARIDNSYLSYPKTLVPYLSGRSFASIRRQGFADK